jgi:anti-repressor protein
MGEIIKRNGMMSSKGISEKTGKTHGNVLRDIRSMLHELQNSDLKPSDYQVLVGENSMTSEILLNERLSLLLSSGYSVKLRLMIIDAWAELKANELNHKIPQSLSEALLLASNLAKENEEQKTLIEQSKPKVEFFNTVANTDTTYDLGVVAKNLDLDYGRNTLFKLLRERKILNAENVPYQRFVDSGYFELKQTTFVGEKGKLKVHFQSRVTDKGLKWLHKNLKQNK